MSSTPWTFRNPQQVQCQTAPSDAVQLAGRSPDASLPLRHTCRPSSSVGQGKAARPSVKHDASTWLTDSCGVAQNLPLAEISNLVAVQRRTLLPRNASTRIPSYPCFKTSLMMVGMSRRIDDKHSGTMMIVSVYDERSSREVPSDTFVGLASTRCPRAHLAPLSADSRGPQMCALCLVRLDT